MSAADPDLAAQRYAEAFRPLLHDHPRAERLGIVIIHRGPNVVQEQIAAIDADGDSFDVSIALGDHSYPMPQPPSWSDFFRERGAAIDSWVLVSLAHDGEVQWTFHPQEVEPSRPRLSVIPGGMS